MVIFKIVFLFFLAKKLVELNVVVLREEMSKLLEVEKLIRIVDLEHVLSMALVCKHNNKFLN